MSIQPKNYMTVDEYLVFEHESEYKSEYFDGEIFAMAGASPAHVLIVTNVVSELRFQLKKRHCTVYSTDLRVRVTPTGFYTYPDVVVVCGKPLFDKHKETLLNPSVIIEVLSESTKDYDRGGKFEHYRRLESLTEYIMIDQNKHHAEHFIKQTDNKWLLSEINFLENVIMLNSIGCVLPLTEVYDKVELSGKNY